MRVFQSTWPKRIPWANPASPNGIVIQRSTSATARLRFPSAERGNAASAEIQFLKSCQPILADAVIASKLSNIHPPTVERANAASAESQLLNLAQTNRCGAVGNFELTTFHSAERGSAASAETNLLSSSTTTNPGGAAGLNVITSSARDPTNKMPYPVRFISTLPDSINSYRELIYAQPGSSPYSYFNSSARSSNLLPRLNAEALPGSIITVSPAGPTGSSLLQEATVCIHGFSPNQMALMEKSIRVYLWINRFILALRKNPKLKYPHPADEKVIHSKQSFPIIFVSCSLAKAEASALYIAAKHIRQDTSLFEYQGSIEIHLHPIQQSIPDALSIFNYKPRLIRSSRAIQPALTEEDSPLNISVISRRVIYNLINRAVHPRIQHDELRPTSVELRTRCYFFRESQPVTDWFMFFITNCLYSFRNFNVSGPPHPPENTEQRRLLQPNEVASSDPLFIQQQLDSSINPNEGSNKIPHSSLLILQFSQGYQLKAKGWIYPPTPTATAFIHQYLPLPPIKQYNSGYQREAEDYVCQSTPTELPPGSADHLQFRIPNNFTSLLKVNQVVLINDSPFQWKIGTVIRLIEDRAGFIRIAYLCTPSGAMLSRPIQRLHPLTADGKVNAELERF